MLCFGHLLRLSISYGAPCLLCYSSYKKGHCPPFQVGHYPEVGFCSPLNVHTVIFTRTSLSEITCCGLLLVRRVMYSQSNKAAPLFSSSPSPYLSSLPPDASRSPPSIVIFYPLAVAGYSGDEEEGRLRQRQGSDDEGRY